MINCFALTISTPSTVQEKTLTQGIITALRKALITYDIELELTHVEPEPDDYLPAPYADEH